MPTQAGQQVKDGREQQEDGGGDQAGGRRQDQAEPLHQAHDAVHGGAHVVGAEAAHELVELGRGRADAQQEGDLEEDEDQAGDPVERDTEASERSRDDRGRRVGGLQADDAEDDDEADVEDVGDAEGDAEDDAEDAGPVGTCQQCMLTHPMPMPCCSAERT